MHLAGAANSLPVLFSVHLKDPDSRILVGRQLSSDVSHGNSFLVSAGAAWCIY